MSLRVPEIKQSSLTWLHACMFSRIRLFVTPSTVVRLLCPWNFMDNACLFFRQEYWSGLSFPTPGHLSDPEIRPESLASPRWQAVSLPLSHLGSPFIDVKGGKNLCSLSCLDMMQYIELIEISLMMETGRRLGVKPYVMTRGQRLPTSNGFTASHTYCSFYTIFPPLPWQSTMETVFQMAQVQRAKCLPRVSLTLLCKLQYIRISGTKVTSTTAHLYCTRDGMGRIRKRKQKIKTSTSMGT